jgi:4-amino-4-deoxy-L-arabinose transferase-like glycosyltransferase
MTIDIAPEQRATEQRVLDRRARFRDAVVRLSERAQSAELVRLLLFPGALAVVGGFAFMILGWYGASHTARPIEQTPYLISGGLIGLGLVMVGALLLSSAIWMTMLQRHQSEQDERVERKLDQLRDELAPRRRRAASK